MAAMATTLITSLSKTQFFNNKSSFHGSPMLTRAAQPVKSTPHNLSATMSAATPPYNLNNFKFQPIKESIVSREMTRRYMITYADTDVVVIGAGSTGLSCAYEQSKNPNINIAIIEQSVSPNGGAWLGGQLFSAMVVRKPANPPTIEIEYDEQKKYVVIKHAALFTSTIMSNV